MGIHVFVVDWLCPLLVSSFCGGQWGKILVPLLWGEVPRRGGVVGATQNHPVRLRLTTPPKEGNGHPRSPTGGDLLCSAAGGGGVTRLLEMRPKEIAPAFSGAGGDRGGGTGPPPWGGVLGTINR